LKDVAAGNWNSDNESTDNSSGFAALPGGFRNKAGFFIYLGKMAFYWSSSMIKEGNAWGYSLKASNYSLNRVESDVTSGFSIRCLKNK